MSSSTSTTSSSSSSITVPLVMSGDQVFCSYELTDHVYDYYVAGSLVYSVDLTDKEFSSAGDDSVIALIREYGEVNEPSNFQNSPQTGRIKAWSVAFPATFGAASGDGVIIYVATRQPTQYYLNTTLLSDVIFTGEVVPTQITERGFCYAE